MIKSNTKTFVQIYETLNDFIYDYNNLAIPRTISVDNASILYYLLYGKYGNSFITNFDVNQFKYKLFSIIWQYGPTWEKRLEIQSTLRNLTEADLKAGAIKLLQNSGTIGNTGSDTYNNLKTANTGKDVLNHAYNPESAPSTYTDGELPYINQQDVTKYGKDSTTTGSISKNNTQTNNLSTTDTLTKGTLEAYSQLWEMLDNDVTEGFIREFGILFKKFINPCPILYESEEDE